MINMDIPEEVRISDLMVCKVGKLTKSISVRTGIESVKEDIIFKTICYNPRGTDTYIDLNDDNIYRSWHSWIDPQCEKTKLSILSKGLYSNYYREYLNEKGLKSSDTISLKEIRHQAEELLNASLFEIQKTRSGIEENFSK